MQTPSIGRIVLYTTEEAQPKIRPAIISEILDSGEVHLNVFVPTQRGNPVEVLFKVPHTAYEAGRREACGCWSWPVRI